MRIAVPLRHAALANAADQLILRHPEKVGHGCGPGLPRSMLAHHYPSVGLYAKLTSHGRGSVESPGWNENPASDSERHLGRCWWVLLHALAESYPESGTYQEKSNWFRFVELMALLHPVTPWRSDASKLLRHSPPNVSSKTGVTEWAVEVHNAVNVSLGKPTVDVHSWSKNLVIPRPTKPEIGRAVWQLLYGLASSYSVVPDQQTQRSTSEFLNLIGSVYPCVDCRTSFAAILARHPPCCASRQGLSAWIANVHQIVNTQLGKPVQPPPTQTAAVAHLSDSRVTAYMPRMYRAGMAKALMDGRGEAEAGPVASPAEPSMRMTMGLRRPWTAEAPGSTLSWLASPLATSTIRLDKADVDLTALQGSSSGYSAALRASTHCSRVPGNAALAVRPVPFAQPSNDGITMAASGTGASAIRASGIDISGTGSVYASRAREAFQLPERNMEIEILPTRSASAMPLPTSGRGTWRVPNRVAGSMNPSRNCRVCRG